MDLVYLISGIVIVTLTLIEALWTTLWVDGDSGPITSRFTTLIWKLFRFLTKSGNHKLLSLAGPFILFITVFSWISLLFFGWIFIFYSDPDSIHSNSKVVPDFVDHLWYIGYTIFTVGNGDFKPNGDIWQVLSAMVAFTGMGMVTLTITYIMQVITAVTNKRSFASQITGVGKTAEEFVQKQWTGNGFGAIELQLTTFNEQLSLLNEQHLAFPILHYYHAERPEKSQDLAIAIFDDALNLIEFGVEEKYNPAETILSSSRASVDSFLITVKKAFIHPADEVPKKPELSILKKNGIPTIPEEEFHQKLEKEHNRRKLILGLINQGAWKWPS